VPEATTKLGVGTVVSICKVPVKLLLAAIARSALAATEETIRHLVKAARRATESRVSAVSGKHCPVVLGRSAHPDLHKTSTISELENFNDI
jgi:hypothetical protein